MVTAVIVAAGRSERMGAGTDKAFLNLGSKPILAWSLLAFERCTDVDAIVLVVRKDQLTAAQALVKMFGISRVSKVVAGGTRRQDSVRIGLAEVDSATRIVVVHDGVRPCVTSEMISNTIKLARRTGAAVVGRRIWDTVKVVEKGTTISSTADRAKLWGVQTPQAFNAQLIRKAYDALEAAGKEVTDDAAAVELLGEPVRIHETNLANPKITTVDDLQIAAAVLKL